MLSKKDNETL
jgi:hypothetical protein